LNTSVSVNDVTIQGHCNLFFGGIGSASSTFFTDIPARIS
jgi:hypothetical protein